jgi:HEAT repeat protein
MVKQMIPFVLVFLFFLVLQSICYGDEKDEIDSLIAVLKDRDARVKAVEALGDIGDTNVVKVLIECLDDRDENVRFMAIVSLGKIGDKRAVEPLCRILHSSKDIPIIFRFASYGLQIAVPSSSSVPSIAEDSTARDEDILEAAEWSLGEIGEEAVPFLIEGLGDESANVRYLVLETLRDINDIRIIDPFINLLKDEDEYIRANAIQALGEMGDKKVIKPLKKMLEDESELVRKAAAIAIKELEKKEEKQ